MLSSSSNSTPWNPVTLTLSAGRETVPAEVVQSDDRVDHALKRPRSTSIGRHIIPHLLTFTFETRQVCDRNRDIGRQCVSIRGASEPDTYQYPAIGVRLSGNTTAVRVFFMLLIIFLVIGTWRAYRFSVLSTRDSSQVLVTEYGTKILQLAHGTRTAGNYD